MGRIKNWKKTGDGAWSHVSMKYFVDIEFGDHTQEIEHVADLIIMDGATSTIEIASSMDINEIRALAVHWMRSHPDPKSDR